MRAVTITALLVSVGLLGLAAAGSGSVTASTPPPLPMPADSERRLAAGEIIVLDVLPPGASPDAQGGTAVALVRAPVEIEARTRRSGTPRRWWMCEVS